MGHRMPKVVNEVLQDAIVEVARLSNFLAAVQGERARRNARGWFKTALRKLEAQADQAYPPPPRKVGKRPTYEGLNDVQVAVYKKRKLRTQGYTLIPPHLLRGLAEAGVQVKSVRVGGSVETFAPVWAVQIGDNVSKLRRARRDIQYRKAMATEAELKKTVPLQK